jgi:hypothetical protein
MALHVDGDANCNGADGSEAMPYCTIQAAVMDIGMGQKGVVFLHEAAGPYNESITVDGNASVVAFIAAEGEAPVWRNGLGASLRADLNGTVFAHNILFQNSTNSVLLLSAGGVGHVTSCQMSNSAAAAISVSDGTLFMQNSFVGVQNVGIPAISVTAGTFDLEYSTLGAGFGASAIALSCVNGAGSTIRNSIALNFSASPAISCPSLTQDGVFAEGDADATFDDQSQWFADFANGDFHIDILAAPPEFVTPASTFATWSAGDPTMDIDGDPRPNVEGQAGYVGADVPQ